MYLHSYKHNISSVSYTNAGGSSFYAQNKRTPSLYFIIYKDVINSQLQKHVWNIEFSYTYYSIFLS